MLDAAQTGLLSAHEVARSTPLGNAANGLRYTSFGYTEVPADSLQHIVEAVPPAVAAALARHAYYFVPLAIGETEETEIARGYSADLGDRATCHRNVISDGVDCTFISARLMQDRFALAFEFFINIGHQLVDAAGVPRPFQSLVWAQARADVRGETSQDAFEARARALQTSSASSEAILQADLNADRHSKLADGTEATAEPAPHGLAISASQEPPSRRSSSRGLSLFASRDAEGSRFKPISARPEAARAETLRAEAAREAIIHAEIEHATEEQVTFFEAAFADILAIYMLSLAMDLDYADLREREYPLLAAPALADRLRLAAELYPPAPTYEFSIRYRRRQ